MFLHNTPFDLEALGLEQIKLDTPKLHRLTSILKTARLKIELTRFAKREDDNVYFKYMFSNSYKGVKNVLRSLSSLMISTVFNSEKGLSFIKNSINFCEKRTLYFYRCLSVLQLEKPDFVFCTSQRSSLAIAPILAAKQLKIPTATFIFSWDNMPKAKLDVPAEYFNVWSNYMKTELLQYYPKIKEDAVFVTGTPQFESYYTSAKRISKHDFFTEHGLDLNKIYFCYSGDDITTSPKDELYLRDVAEAIRQLNKVDDKYGLIFRRCPVDFSNRYNNVIEDYKEEITPIEPMWKKIKGAWDGVLPLPEDTNLLYNLIHYTEGVINLGSSMVFDYVIQNKPCYYMNYNYLNPESTYKSGVYVYDYVHFRSKPDNDVVVWLNKPSEIANKLKTVSTTKEVIDSAKRWYKKINMHPPELASVKICDSIETIINKTK